MWRLNQYLEHSFNDDANLVKSFNQLLNGEAAKHLRVKELFETIEVWKKEPLQHQIFYTQRKSNMTIEKQREMYLL